MRHFNYFCASKPSNGGHPSGPRWQLPVAVLQGAFHLQGNPRSRCHLNKIGWRIWTIPLKCILKMDLEDTLKIAWRFWKFSNWRFGIERSSHLGSIDISMWFVSQAFVSQILTNHSHYVYIYRCFLTWWYPQKHPKMIIFSRKIHGCWVPPF